MSKANNLALANVLRVYKYNIKSLFKLEIKGRYLILEREKRKVRFKIPACRRQNSRPVNSHAFCVSLTLSRITPIISRISLARSPSPLNWLVGRQLTIFNLAKSFLKLDNNRIEFRTFVEN